MKSLPEHPVYAGAHLLPWTAPFVLVFDAYILEFSAAEHYGKAASTPNDDAAVEEYTRGTIQVVQLAGMASPLAETPRAPIRAPGAIDLTSTAGPKFVGGQCRFRSDRSHFVRRNLARCEGFRQVDGGSAPSLSP